MDIFSLMVGFSVGAFTGAAGGYLADKYTDKRRTIENQQSADDEWAYVCNKFPSIVAEMKSDIEDEDYVGVRQFFIKELSAVLSGGNQVLCMT